MVNNIMNVYSPDKLIINYNFGQEFSIKFATGIGNVNHFI